MNEVQRMYGKVQTADVWELPNFLAKLKWNFAARCVHSIQIPLQRKELLSPPFKLNAQNSLTKNVLFFSLSYSDLLTLFSAFWSARLALNQCPFPSVLLTWVRGHSGAPQWAHRAHRDRLGSSSTDGPGLPGGHHSEDEPAMWYCCKRKKSTAFCSLCEGMILLPGHKEIICVEWPGGQPGEAVRPWGVALSASGKRLSNPLFWCGFSRRWTRYLQRSLSASAALIAVSCQWSTRQRKENVWPDDLQTEISDSGHKVLVGSACAVVPCVEKTRCNRKNNWEKAWEGKGNVAVLPLVDHSAASHSSAHAAGRKEPRDPSVQGPSCCV